ncbi:cardiomyopathy-associated protein 5 [Xenentodon cancila]
MDECESLDLEVAELQEFQGEALDTISQDDEDEVEELQNSLRAIVQDQSVKPKLQCLMVDPSFSMVTVQSEDSGIVWETASSRCSTPWASEASSTSEAYSMEGSGGAGKITIVFDEEKVVRTRTRSGGRSSRLGDRLSRPGSSRSASALGVERPEMAEVSLPNVKQEKAKTKVELEEIKTKDQQLFSLISEGYEILNIRVPSKLPTVDEEESTELQDNLSYLDQTPKIKSRSHQTWAQQKDHDVPEEELPDHTEPSKPDSSHPSGDTELGDTPTQKESPGDIDYFEKFTLLDEAVPGGQETELQEEAAQPAAKPRTEEQKPVKEVATDSSSVSEDSFVFVTDAEIVGEHLDEVFYGEGPPAGALQQRGEDKQESGARMRRESQRLMKGSGSVLFESEETTLTPIFISPGPPKIIDPILLEEPTAMSFMYTDLYEDAMGERRRSDEECSEAESMASEKSYKRRLSESEEADGYLEKFTLKDETPTVDVQSDSVEDEKEGRMVWPQSKFEMTGCLIRVAEVKEDEEKTKTEQPQLQEKTDEDLHSEMMKEVKEIVTGAEENREEVQLVTVAEDQTTRETSGDSTREPELMEKQMEHQRVQHEVKTDKTKLPVQSTETMPQTPQVDVKVDETLEEEDCPRRDEKIREQSSINTEQIHEAGKAVEKIPEIPAVTTDNTTLEIPAVTTDNTTLEIPRTFQVPPVGTETKLERENTECRLPTEAADDSKTVQPQVEEAERVTLSLTEALAEIETSDDKPVPEGAPCVEVITDCDCAVQTVVEISEKELNEKEIQTQVEIDLHEVKSVEASSVRTAASQGEEELQWLTEETAADSTPLKYATDAADQESEVEAEILREVTKASTPEEVSTESEKKHQQIGETEKQQQPTTDCESEKTQQMPQASSSIPEEDTGTSAQDAVSVADELILLVPKGQAIEMDIDVGQRSEVAKEDTVAPHEPEGTSELQEPGPEIEVKPEVMEEKPPRKDLDRGQSHPAPVEEAGMADWKTEKDVGEDKDEFSPLRSFNACEDLSGLHTDDTNAEEADVEQKAEMEDIPERTILREDAAPGTDLHSQGVGQKRERDEAAEEAVGVTVDELSYEIIPEQDAKDVEESETKGNIEETAQEQEGKMDIEVEKDQEDDLFTEEHITADYEIIDAEEESQARLAAELQGMNWFCVTCACLLSEDEFVSGDHHSHQVDSVDKAYEEIQESLGGWISELQARSENIEDLVSELELAYNSVEDQFMQSEAAMQAQNEEMMALVMEQYNGMSVSTEEEKKAKLEQLYDKIVSFQEHIDSAKSTLETTAREAETDARSPEDIHARLKAALDSVLSLDLGSKGLLVFEDYAKPNVSTSNVAQRKGIPVPQRPTLQRQESGSATSTSVTVYWKINPGDVIDCFQVYCMEDPQGAVSEEYRVTVKESYCVLEELEPDRMYKVWVMAVNYTGCSLPSERLVFRTAPSVPVIDTELCTVMWDSATLRWSSTKQTPGQSYTLEYCRQYELEGEGLRSVSGIKVCEQKVLLQPNENYLFYIKAVNEAGASDQSEAALISTKGTRFHLLKASAHPALELSDDQTTLHYSQDAHKAALMDKLCPSILGDMFPPQGMYYWETIVTGSKAYRLGVESSTTERNSSLGENSSSWCLHCVPTPSGCRYQLLHNGVQSSVFVIEEPERVGVLLDYQLGCLSFYNAKTGQLLGSFRRRFTEPCHPALALEHPGSLQLCMVQEVPEFTKDS